MLSPARYCSVGLVMLLMANMERLKYVGHALGRTIRRLRQNALAAKMRILQSASEIKRNSGP